MATEKGQCFAKAVPDSVTATKFVELSKKIAESAGMQPGDVEMQADNS